MEAVFLKLVNQSIAAGWLVLAVVVLRLVLRRAPRWSFCLLWGLVALRLLWPFSVESVLSLVPSARALPPEILYTAAPQISSGIPALNSAVNPALAASLAPAPGASANPTQIWSFVLARLWLAGMVLLLLYALVSYLRLRRRVSTATLLRENIRQSEWVDTPFVLGLLRPVIYLPYRLEDRDLAYVIAHERAHIRRGDHWWKVVGFVLLAVYWFHPLLWAAYVLLCRDIEGACDEKVIRELGQEDRRGYASALFRCGGGVLSHGPSRQPQLSHGRKRSVGSGTPADRGADQKDRKAGRRSGALCERRSVRSPADVRLPVGWLGSGPVFLFQRSDHVQCPAEAVHRRAAIFCDGSPGVAGAEPCFPAARLSGRPEVYASDGDPAALTGCGWVLHGHDGERYPQ